MKRMLKISLGTAALATLTALFAHRALSAGPDPGMQIHPPTQVVTKMTLVAPTDPTRFPNWKPISDDLGILLREDDRWGYRAGLYAKIDGKWWPIAIDGIESIGAVPLKQ